MLFVDGGATEGQGVVGVGFLRVVIRSHFVHPSDALLAVLVLSRDDNKQFERLRGWHHKQASVAIRVCSDLQHCHEPPTVWDSSSARTVDSPTIASSTTRAAARTRTAIICNASYDENG